MTSSKTRSPQRTPRCIRDGAPRSSPASCFRVLLHHVWGPSRSRKTKRARVPALSRVAPRATTPLRNQCTQFNYVQISKLRSEGAGVDWPGGRVPVSRGYFTIRQRYFSQTRRHEAIDYVGLYRVLCRLARSWEHRSAELGELRAAQVGIVAATRE